MARQIKQLENGQIIQVFIHKWVCAYVIVSYEDMFEALCPKGDKKVFNYTEQNDTWRIPQ